MPVLGVRSGHPTNAGHMSGARLLGLRRWRGIQSTPSRRFPKMSMTSRVQASIATVLLSLSFAAGLAVAAGDLEPGPRSWTDYRGIMWIGDSASRKPEKLPLFFQR